MTVLMKETLIQFLTLSIIVETFPNQKSDTVPLASFLINNWQLISKVITNFLIQKLMLTNQLIIYKIKEEIGIMTHQWTLKTEENKE